MQNNLESTYLILQTPFTGVIYRYWIKTLSKLWNKLCKLALDKLFLVLPKTISSLTSCLKTKSAKRRQFHLQNIQSKTNLNRISNALASQGCLLRSSDTCTNHNVIYLLKIHPCSWQIFLQVELFMIQVLIFGYNLKTIYRYYYRRSNNPKKRARLQKVHHEELEVSK